MADPLLVFAMEQESQNVFNNYNVIHTGIGKTNAAYGLMSALRTEKPSCIINMGTAGSRKHGSGLIINATSFVQRDMDVTPLGFEPFQTPFSNDPVTLEYGKIIDGLTQGICGTGDNFDTSEIASKFDVVDMEAYALALICQRERIPFLCLKYISDGADDNAHIDWNETLNKAAHTLHDTLKRIDL